LLGSIDGTDRLMALLSNWRQTGGGMAATRLRPPMVMARTVTIGMRLRRVGPLDLCIQHGTEYVVPRSVRYVVYVDATIRQAAPSYQWSHLEGMRPADIDIFARRDRRIFQRAVACCAMSEWAARSIVDDYGIDESKVHVVGVGPNHDVEPVPDRAWSPPRFVFISADWGRKNGAGVLSAFAQLRRARPDAVLEIIGDHPRLVAEGVVGHGFLSLNSDLERGRLTRVLQRATVLLAPSLHDPSPVVHVEAAAAGVASIGTLNGGAATIVGDAGLLVDPREERELVAAMAALCEPGLARELGARARARSRLFTWQLVAQRLLRAGCIPGVDRADLAEFL
jgi:glycosyltransferase involved in cell wall biosynthesis